MSVMPLLMVTGFFMAVGFLGAFVWAVKSGQYRDHESPPEKILWDE